MAQFSQGADILSTRVVLLNPDSGQFASATVRFRDSTGQLVPVRLKDGSSGSTYFLQIPPLGMRVLETTSEGDLVSGWVSVDSDRVLAGNVLFGGSTGLAGVPSSPALSTTFAVPILMRPLAVRTGIALANLAEVSGEAAVELISEEGAPISTAAVDLEPGGHVTLYADEFGWDVDSLDFTHFDGSLRITPTVPLAATVLQSQPQELLTLPVSSGAGDSAVADGTTNLSLDFELRDQEGLLVAQSSLDAPLPAAGQTALFITELNWSSGVSLDDFTGVVKVIPTGPCATTVLLTGRGQFATLPAEPLPQ